MVSRSVTPQFARRTVNPDQIKPKAYGRKKQKNKTNKTGSKNEGGETSVYNPTSKNQFG